MRVKAKHKSDRKNEKPSELFPSCYQESGKRQIKIHFVVGREKKSCVKTKNAVYFMITTLTYANNFDIMKGMMNIKHIKIK